MSEDHYDLTAKDKRYIHGASSAQTKQCYTQHIASSAMCNAKCNLLLPAHKALQCAWGIHSQETTVRFLYQQKQKRQANPRLGLQTITKKNSGQIQRGVCEPVQTKITANPALGLHTSANQDGRQIQRWVCRLVQIKTTGKSSDGSADHYKPRRHANSALGLQITTNQDNMQIQRWVCGSVQTKMTGKSSVVFANHH